MKKKIIVFCVGTASILFLSGCATTNTGSKKNSTETSQSAVDKNELELIDMKMKQLLAIAETSLELSQKADETSQEALALSQQAKDSTDTALEASKAAIIHVDERTDEAIQAANKAIESSNLASEKAIAIANQSMAEMNRLRATIKMQEEIEPILKEEPAVIVSGKIAYIARTSRSWTIWSF